MENEQQSKSTGNENSDEKSWTSGDNSMTNMSDEERKRHLGYNPGPGEPSLEEREKQSEANAESSKSDDTDD